MAIQVRFRNHVMLLAIALVLALGAGITNTTPTAAGDTRCGAVPHDPNMIPAPTPEYFANFEFLFGGTYDNLVVPPGTWCFALGVTVLGNAVVSGPGSKPRAEAQDSAGTTLRATTASTPATTRTSIL